MLADKFKPVRITDHFYKLGTDFFSVYLSVGEDAMLIEGGASAATDIIIEQINEIGISPERIKYIALTHSHGDHIGSISYLKRKWNHIRLAASIPASKMLANQTAIDSFLALDDFIWKKMKSTGETDKLPEKIELNLNVDILLEEGNTMDLGKGISWKIYSAPGHASCQIAFHEEKEGIIASGDAGGLLNRKENTFWPNYFESLEQYTNSIRKLSAIPAKHIAMGHFGVMEKYSGTFFKDSLKGTEKYHMELLQRVKNGETIESIGKDKADWINTYVADMPYKIMEDMSKLTVKRSLKEAEKANLFL